MSITEMNKTEKPLTTLWGCELSETHKEVTFKIDDTTHQHQLALRTMCLGHTAIDEFNIVELITGEGKENTKAVPIATLHVKSMPTVNLSGLELQPPVTFRLRVGSGPVFIGAEHLALEEDFSEEELDDEEEDMDEEVEEEEEDIEESPAKKVAKNGGSVKRKKPEKGDDDGAGSEGENNPPKKGKGRSRKPLADKV